MKALAGKMRWVNRGRGKEGSIELCSTVPEAGRGMPYALAHTELGIGMHSARGTALADGEQGEERPLALLSSQNQGAQGRREQGTGPFSC